MHRFSREKRSDAGSLRVRRSIHFPERVSIGGYREGPASGLLQIPDFEMAMALGGVIWGSAAAIAGASYSLLGAAVLFLTTLLLTRRLSINIAENLEEIASDDLSIRVESKGVAPIALTRELLAA